MTLGRLWEEPYQSSAHSLKGDADNGVWDEGCGQWLPRCRLLALRALLTEGPDVGIHCTPEEPVP